MHYFYNVCQVMTKLFLINQEKLIVDGRPKSNITLYQNEGGRRGRDRMVVGFTTNCAISAYHH